jgi:hypothetical protein
MFVTAGRVLTIAAILTLGATAARAQTWHAPTPPPVVTADREAWYLAGHPITWAGNIYYPAGPQVHFNRDEMVRSGFFLGIPLYVRTTIEPGSIVFVPLSGGVMQPYERVRAGELAGTTGSTAPSFPVVLPAEQDDYLEQVGMADWQAPRERPGMLTAGMVGWMPGERTTPAGPEALAPAAAPSPSAVVGRAGPGVFRSAALPQGLNGVYVTYDGRRWFSDEPAVEYDPARFERIGEYGEYPVYRDARREGVIFVQIFEGAPGLLSVYRAR